MPDMLVDWVNTRGPVILDRLYDLLPLMVISAVSAALIVYWALGEDRGTASTKPADGHGSDCGQWATRSTEDSRDANGGERIDPPAKDYSRR